MKMSVKVCFWGLMMILSTRLFSQNWQPLFDGKTLNGWAVLDKPANVKIADSSMVLKMTPYTSRHAFVRTNKKYKNFIFEVEYKRDLTLDSGVLFRGIDAPDTAFSALFGYMVKIDPQPTRLWTGGIFIDFGNGYQWLKPLEGDDNARKAEKKGGEWNTLRIEAQGQNLKVWLNGVPTVNLLDDKYTEEGYIAFKIHYLQKEVEKSNLAIAFRQPKIITKNLSKYAQNMPLPVTDTRGVWKIHYFR
jgi:hypothetical protein